MLSVILMSVDMESTDRNKLEKLYIKYRNTLFSQALYIVKNETEAEDILHNAFIKIAKNIKAVGDIESKETLAFLLVITKNTAYDHIRKAYFKRSVPIKDIEEVPQLDKSIENIATELQYEKLVSVIKSVPSPYNEVLYLHYVREFSVKQTAVLLDRKSSTVKMQLVRGKKILLKELSEVLYE